MFTASPGVNVGDLYYEFDDIASKCGDAASPDTGGCYCNHRLDTICIPPRGELDEEVVCTHDTACCVNEVVEVSTVLGACTRDSDCVVCDATEDVGHG